MRRDELPQHPIELFDLDGFGEIGVRTNFHPGCDLAPGDPHREQDHGQDTMRLTGRTCAAMVAVMLANWGAQRSFDRRVKSLTLALAVTLGFAAFLAPRVDGVTNSYDCNPPPLPSDVWCKSNEVRAYHAGQAAYLGSGTMPYVCNKFIYAVNEGITWAWACAYDANSVYHSFQLCNCGGLKPLHKHGAPLAHAMSGYAYYY